MPAVIYKKTVYGAPESVETLTDTEISSLADGDILEYDDTSGKWKNSNALDNKVDKVSGKGLSTNDYTTAEKEKLAGIAAGAEANVQPDWNQADSSADDYIKNKPSEFNDTRGSQTATGTVVTTTDAASIYAEQVDVAVVATQSGSGTPSPSNVRAIQGYDIVSVDKKKKNLFNKNAISTSNAYLRNDGGTQQPSSGSEWRISAYIRVLAGEKYTISNMNTTASAPSVCWYDKNKNYISGQSYSGNSQITITIPSNAYYIRFSVILSLIDTAQVEKGQTATTYEPYNGQTIDCQLGNKNLLPMTVEGIKAANTSGTWSGNVYSINNGTVTLLTDENGLVTGWKANGTFNAQVAFVLSNTPISVQGKTELFNGMPSSGLSSTTKFLNVEFTKTDNTTGNWNIYENEYSSASFSTTIKTIDRVLIYIRSGQSLTNEVWKPMIRGSKVTDSTFSPYNPTLGGMVYGGNLTLNDDGSAVFVGTYGEVDLGEVTYGNYPSLATSGTFVFSVSNRDTTQPAMLCSAYNPRVVSSWNDLNNGEVIARSGETDLRLRNTSCTTNEQIIAANKGQQFVYKLAIPFTINLSVEQLQLLSGIDNLWSNAGDVTLKYQPDNVIAEPKADVQELRDYVDDRLVGNACKNLLSIKDI